MQIRVIGAKDQIQRLARLLPVKLSIRPSRKSDTDLLLYLNVDDRLVEEWLARYETEETPFIVRRSP